MSSQATASGGPSARPQTVELAGLRRRLASMLYESLLLLGVLALTFMVPLLILGIGTDYTPGGGVLWIYIFAVLGMYFLWYWRRGGQTLAMQTWKLRIVNSDGKPVSLRQGWIRYALAWPSVLLFGVGLVWALIDKDRQFLHDRLAGTRIVLLPASTLI
ncbi:RDD family protein [Zoogloea sp.]|uniref:RDD family protein n=1 Tax=Zoogloea sp. TaxID=49181 RepID=UPI0025F7870A|nr:RDD family protein [Zoogloea sp.]MCK6392351.1 RDD family protein [Zoogloea sp.]